MAALSTIATAALVTSAVAGVASTGYSMYQSTKQAKEAKKLQREQRAQIAEEQKKATAERKGLLSAQRYQMGLDDSYSTTGTSDVGRSITTGEGTLG